MGCCTPTQACHGVQTQGVRFSLYLERLHPHQREETVLGGEHNSKSLAAAVFAFGWGGHYWTSAGGIRRWANARRAATEAEVSGGGRTCRRPSVRLWRDDGPLRQLGT